MEQEPFLYIDKNLQDVPNGTLIVEHHFDKHREVNLFAASFQSNTDGKGKMSAYQIFPGIQLSLNYYHAGQASFQHDSHTHILEINHCRLGRIGWDFHNGTSIYLGPGDLALPSSPVIDSIFSPMYTVPEDIRLPYFKLKVQELLLYLGYLNPLPAGLTRYCSRQTATIKEIHAFLTEHLDRRYTIEELSKKYLINTSSLKEIFKGVYGLPVATYMKEYRIRKGMELLRQTDDSIAQIAAKVGYETQGKFTKAFKDIVKTTPTAFRKNINI